MKKDLTSCFAMPTVWSRCLCSWADAMATIDITDLEHRCAGVHDWSPAQHGPWPPPSPCSRGRQRGGGGAGHSASDSERKLLRADCLGAGARGCLGAGARGGGRVDGRRRRPREEAAASRRGGIKGLTRVSWDGG